MKAQITVLIDVDILQRFEKNFVGIEEGKIGKSRSIAIENLMKQKNSSIKEERITTTTQNVINRRK